MDREPEFGEDLGMARSQIILLKEIAKELDQPYQNKELALISCKKIVEASAKALTYRRGICRSSIPKLKVIHNKAKSIIDDNFDQLSLEKANTIAASVKKEVLVTKRALAEKFQETSSIVEGRLSRLKLNQPLKVKDHTVESVFKSFDKLSDALELGPNTTNSGDLFVSDGQYRQNKYAGIQMDKAHQALTKLKPTKLKTKVDPDLGYIIDRADLLIDTYPGLSQQDLSGLVDKTVPILGGFNVFKDQLIIGINDVSNKGMLLVKRAVEAINDKSPSSYYFRATNSTGREPGQLGENSDVHLLRLPGNSLTWIWLPLLSTRKKLGGNITIEYCGFIDGRSISKLKEASNNSSSRVEHKMQELLSDASVARLYRNNTDGLRTLAIKTLEQEANDSKRNKLANKRQQTQEKIADHTKMKALISKNELIQKNYDEVNKNRLNLLGKLNEKLSLSDKELHGLLIKGVQFFEQYADQKLWQPERNYAARNISNLSDRKVAITKIDLKEKEFKAKAIEYIELWKRLGLINEKLKNSQERIDNLEEALTKKFGKEFANLT